MSKPNGPFHRRFHSHDSFLAPGCSFKQYKGLSDAELLNALHSEPLLQIKVPFLKYQILEDLFSDVEPLASYNWIDNSAEVAPTIVVPGLFPIQLFVFFPS